MSDTVCVCILVHSATNAESRRRFLYLLVISFFLVIFFIIYLVERV